MNEKDEKIFNLLENIAYCLSSIYDDNLSESEVDKVWADLKKVREIMSE